MQASEIRLFVMGNNWQPRTQTKKNIIKPYLTAREMYTGTFCGQRSSSSYEMRNWRSSLLSGVPFVPWVRS